MIDIVLAYSRSTTAQSNGPSWTSTFRLVAKLWQRLLESFLDSYQPELHYMRGPGPRRQLKHQTSRSWGQRTNTRPPEKSGF